MRPLLSLLLLSPGPAFSAALTRVAVPSRATAPFAVPSAPSLGPAALAPSLQSLPLTPSLAPAVSPSVAAPQAVTALPAALRPLAAAFPAAAEAPRARAAADGAPAAPARADDDDEAAVEQAAHAERTGSRKPHVERLFDGAAEMRRPLEEVWVVAGQRYESTRALLAAAASLPASAPAKYRYSHVPSAPLSRGAHAAVSSLAGAAVTGALGAGFFALSEGPAYLLRFLSGGLGLESLLVSAVLLGTGAAIAATISLEGTREKREAGEADGLSGLEGTLELREGPVGPRPWFVVRRGRETAVVDLLNHSFAEPLDEPELPEPLSPLSAGLAGAAAGVALALVQWIPLLQILILPAAGPAVGAALAKALAGESRLPWGVLGGLLGLAFPIIAFVSFGSVGRIGMLATLQWYLGLFAVLGAALGALALNAYREREALQAHRNPPSQWWASRPEHDAP